jgi:hypothetical protein
MKKRKVFVIIDESGLTIDESVWKVFSTIDKAEKFLSQFPKIEMKDICIIEFILDENEIK